jgi:ElaB/YqjD/DUF883 family membrane-anchored ribosome-binding protein
MNDTNVVSREKLISDLKVVVGDAEELLRLTAGQAGDKLGEVRNRLSGRLDELKDRLGDAEAALLEKGKKVASATDGYVHEHPWQSVGVAAGVAFLLGLLVGRR